MAHKTEIIDGLLYQIRSAHREIIVDGKKTKELVSDRVLVPAPTPDTLQDYIAAGVFDMDKVCQHLINNAAIAAQAAAKRGTSTDTYEKAFGRLWSRFGTDSNLKVLTAYASANELNLNAEITKFLKDVFENGESQEYAAEYISALTDETEVKN